MANPDVPDFTIVGSGLAGALMACYLGKAGRRVDMYERRADPRGHDAERGRSINLALSLRGITALGEVGLADHVLQAAIPMRGRMIHTPAGATMFQPYGKDESQVLYSVSRAGLNLTLIEAAARHPTVRLFFEHRCVGVDLRANAIELDHVVRTSSHQGPASSCRPVSFAVLIGADGAYSAVRSTMQKQERFNFQQDYLSHGYKELTIPAGPGKSFTMEKNALHIWPRRSFMMIALPNSDASFTCTLFWPYEGPNNFAALKSEGDVKRFFEEQFPDAVPLMPTLVPDYFENPVGPLVTMRCSPWHLGGRVLLLGDAAHAVVPFLGQGMNAAFEDCTVLARLLSRDGRSRDGRSRDGQSSRRDGDADALAEFERLRKRHADALADMAIDNFLEMRDKVASRWFRWRKKAQILLYKLFPKWHVPLYNLIQFTTTPYAEARQQTERRGRLTRAAGIGLLILLAAVLVLVFMR